MKRVALFLLILCAFGFTWIGVQNERQAKQQIVPSAPVLDNHIRCVFQDVKGTYWFGTNTAGVFRYDEPTLTQFTVWFKDRFHEQIKSSVELNVLRFFIKVHGINTVRCSQGRNLLQKNHQTQSLQLQYVH